MRRLSGAVNGACTDDRRCRPQWAPRADRVRVRTLGRADASLSSSSGRRRRGGGAVRARSPGPPVGCPGDPARAEGRPDMRCGRPTRGGVIAAHTAGNDRRWVVYESLCVPFLVRRECLVALRGSGAGCGGAVRKSASSDREVVHRWDRSRSRTVAVPPSGSLDGGKLSRRPPVPRGIRAVGGSGSALCDAAVRSGARRSGPRPRRDAPRTGRSVTESDDRIGAARGPAAGRRHRPRPPRTPGSARGGAT